MPKFGHLFPAVSVVCLLAAAAVSQRNNPYSTNPVSTDDAGKSAIARAETKSPAEQRQAPVKPTIFEASAAAPEPLTELYKIGAGDVLFISLRNAQNAGGYFTVRKDGTIDYPLAGENPLVIGKTAEQAAKSLAARIVIYPNPQIEVRVREYVSHKITVSGMVERAGERSLQREAMPLYAIRAEAMVNSAATKVNIRRSRQTDVQTFKLEDEKTGDILIFPGDAVEFAADAQHARPAATDYFYIAGEVNSDGQKPFVEGMTLFQAVTASGGTSGSPKKATVRRKNEKGMLIVAEYDLKAIRDGKSTDPGLLPGDMIEIGN